MQHTILVSVRCVSAHLPDDAHTAKQLDNCADAKYIIYIFMRRDCNIVTDQFGPLDGTRWRSRGLYYISVFIRLLTLIFNSLRYRSSLWQQVKSHSPIWMNKFVCVCVSTATLSTLSRNQVPIAVMQFDGMHNNNKKYRIANTFIRALEESHKM